ncbi:MAG: copper oxidase [Agromyces sp.]|nr:copper oxidase [Agromyces sp.]
MSAAERTRRPMTLRAVWLLPAAVGLLAGLDAALLLLGLPAPITSGRLSQVHGMVLVLGFVGTLVALERATALGRWIGFAAPALLGAGAVLLVVDLAPLIVGKTVLVAGAAAFTLVYLPLWRRQRDAALLTQLLAAALGCAAAILWLGDVAVDRMFPWLIAFVVLTIAAERVELARITMGPHAGGRLLVAGWSTVVALVVSLVHADAGAILLGATLLVLTVWLLRHDVARRTINARGVTRFMAACMLGGYAWLALGAGVLLLGHPDGRPAYDAVLHAVFLGFTLSMIMAHSTTILPAVLRRPLPYRPVFWAPMILLHAGLVMRIGFGDGLGGMLAWQLGGVLNIAALVLFLVLAVGSSIAGEPARPERRPGGRGAVVAGRSVAS